MPEQSLSSKCFCIIVLHDCVPKQQHSPPKAMIVFIVYRLLTLRRKSFFIYENYRGGQITQLHYLSESIDPAGQILLHYK